MKSIKKSIVSSMESTRNNEFLPRKTLKVKNSRKLIQNSMAIRKNKKRKTEKLQSFQT